MKNWTKLKCRDQSVKCFFQAKHFLSDVTAQHYLYTIRIARLHPLFPSLLLYDIIPLCSPLTLKANLLTISFEKVSFHGVGTEENKKIWL